MRSLTYIIFSLLLSFVLFSCSPATTIKGYVQEVNVEIPRWLKVNLMIWNSVDNSTKTISTKLRPNGKFIAKVREDDNNGSMYLVFIDLTSTRFTRDMPSYTLSTGQFFGPIFTQFQLEPGKDIYVEELFLSIPFSVTMNDTQVVSFNDLSFSWDPIKFADYYIVFFGKEPEKNEAVVSYTTEDPIFLGTVAAKTLPYGTKMSVEEVIQNAPYFILKEQIGTGQYTVSITAYNKGATMNSQSIIAVSKEYSVRIE